MRVLTPTGSEAVEKVAVPLLSEMAELMGVVPSWKTIVPVGDAPPLGGVTVAVSVTDCLQLRWLAAPSR